MKRVIKKIKKGLALDTIPVPIPIPQIPQIQIPELFSKPENEFSVSEQDKIILKYPVVLVHGIVAHDRKSFVDFWGRIPKFLQAHGVKVFFGNTDAWGSYQSNAVILKSTIENILVETQAEKVNIIAHSKGGIDSRYLIWRYEFGGKTASLTTISTPHYGAEVSDLLAEQELLYLNPAKRALEIFGQLYGDRHPDLYAVMYQLTRANMEIFNEKVVTDDRVYYQSLYTTMTKASDDLLFSPIYKYIQKISGDNDGLVSAKSASWGANTHKMSHIGISHSQIIDIEKRKIAGFEILSLYKDIIRQLQLKGF